MARKKLNLVRVTIALDPETERAARIRFGILEKQFGRAVSWSGFLAAIVKDGLAQEDYYGTYGTRWKGKK